MLCFRCGSYNADGTDECSVCGQVFSGDDNEGDGSSFDIATNKLHAPYKRGDLIAGRYRVRALIGHGGVGSVFRVRDEEIDAEDALKTISPNLLQTEEEQKLFSKSIRGARKLHHPNVIRLYDEGVDEGRRFFTMKLLEGLTLRKIIRLRHDKGQSFTPEEIGPIFHQLAAALDYAHKTTWHGDLKPENVIILPDLLKVTDFNLVKGLPLKPFLGIAKSKSKGFPYIAPELRVEASRIDRRADIYSLGVILAEILTGLVFEGHFSRAMTAALERLPSKLDGLVRRAVAEHPDGRFNKASELAKALEEALATVGDEGLPTPVGGGSAEKSKKRQPPPPPAETSPGLAPVSSENTAEDQPVTDPKQPAKDSLSDDDGEPPEIGQSQVMLLETGMSEALADSRQHAVVGGEGEMPEFLGGDTIPQPPAPIGGRKSERPDDLHVPPPIGADDEDDLPDTMRGNGPSLADGRVSMRAEDLIETLYSGDDDDLSMLPPPLPSDEQLDASDSYESLPKGALAVTGESGGLPSDEPFLPPPLSDDDEEEPTLSDYGGKQRLREDLASLQQKADVERVMVSAEGEDRNLVNETTPSRSNPNHKKGKKRRRGGIKKPKTGKGPAPTPPPNGAADAGAAVIAGAPKPPPSNDDILKRKSSERVPKADLAVPGDQVETRTAMPQDGDSMEETLDAASLKKVRDRSSPAAHSTPALKPPVVKPSESAAHLRPVAPPMNKGGSHTGTFIAGGAIAVALIGGAVVFLSKQDGDPKPDPVVDVTPPKVAPGSAVVGPAGGVVELDGVTVLIPGGALEDERTVLIARTDDEPPTGVKALSPIFRFTPADTEFRTSAKLTIPFNGDADTDAALYWKRPGGDFEKLSTGAVAGGSLASPLDALGTGFVGTGTPSGAPPGDGDQPDPEPTVAVNTTDPVKVDPDAERRERERLEREEREKKEREAKEREERERERLEREEREARERVARDERDKADRAEADRLAAAKKAQDEMERREREERDKAERERKREEREQARREKEEERRERAEAKKREEDERRERAEAKKREEAEERERKEAEEKAKLASAKKKGECPKGMALVPAGSFAFGSSPGDPMRNFGEKTATTVNVDAYCIDYYEFPNSSKHVPTVGVTWNAAERSCERKGKRLCTEREWERACKGPSNRRFPYGNTYQVDRCNTEDASGQPRELGAARDFKKCRSKFNIFMMSGNAEEWTADNFRGGAGSKAVKGGASDRPDWASRCAARRGLSPTTKKPTLGFRCCADPG
jgi:serine/threonine protein kinase/formylglycine-generating enzyme required for sulfatase activity